MGKTSIEWSQFSVNPLRARLRADPSKVGHYCEKPSPGCLNCYASTFQRRRGLPVFSGTHGRNLELVEPFLDVSRLREVLRRRIPTTWFWADMTDMFGSWVPFEWIAACYGVMAATPWHTHQVLTKRPGRALEFLSWLKNEGRRHWQIGEIQPTASVMCHAHAQLPGELISDMSRIVHHRPWPLPNVWFGISAEDQQRFDERWPLAQQVPAALRFVSYEPALGPVDFRFPGVLKRTKPAGFDGWSPARQEEAIAAAARAEFIARTECPDWIIAGGESGNGARACDLAWLRSACDQCAAAGVAYFCKQLGKKPVDAGAFRWMHHSIERGEQRLYGPAGAHAATLWRNENGRVTWHTWDRAGVGGENGVDRDEPTAKSEALKAVLRAAHFPLRLKNGKGGDPAEWPEDLRVRQMPEVSRG